VTTFEADDVEKFTEVVFKFDQISRLDPWTAKILLAVKNVLKEGVDSMNEEEQILKSKK